MFSRFTNLASLVSACIKVLRKYGFIALREFYTVRKDMDFIPDPSSFEDNISLSVSHSRDLKFYQYKKTAGINASDFAPKLLAFYLPQFHPIPENNEWWGAGFTEWTNVTKATPQYSGHYQPHLPGELGFYDLRLKENQKAQVDLAKLYGISAFVYHYYWFSGRKVLDLPINNVINNFELDMPFCICWANETWSRRWDGSESDILIKQVYNEDNSLEFIKDIYPILCDHRYFRVSGKPLLIVYRMDELPDPENTIAIWRKYCKETGLGDIYIVAALSFNVKDPISYGFDAGVQFPPHNVFSVKVPKISLKIYNKVFSGKVYSYTDMVAGELTLKSYKFPCYKCVFPSWDNEARKPRRGVSFKGSSPENYRFWLEKTISKTIKEHEEGSLAEPLVFINAWNEWAEGAHLEPDRKYGYSYLNETINALSNYPKSGKLI